jgi:5-methylcytosine-specific restriction endonuclease McrA
MRIAVSDPGLKLPPLNVARVVNRRWPVRTGRDPALNRNFSPAKTRGTCDVSAVQGQNWPMSGSWKAPPGWKSIRRAVFAAKGRVCVWCGQPATTVDHVIPAAAGGQATLDNLVPSCARCNFSRGAAFGNSRRPPRPLSAAQRRAIGLKRATGGQETWQSARRW